MEGEDLTAAFSSSAARKLDALKAENESLRTELGQLRLVALQLASPSMKPSASLGSQPPPIGLDTRRVAGTSGRKGAASLIGGKCRRERVKVAFNLLAVKHSIERLRNTVSEVRSSMLADHTDALAVFEQRRKNIDARVANERPLVHRVHEAICELVRHGGHQSAEVLQGLFSATSWGHTKMSLVEASSHIIKELHNLVAVAEQQRRAKEVLEIAAMHKDRCLERANAALLDMAKTSRDVVGTFARLARDVHNLAARQHQQTNRQEKTEDVTRVRSLLVTRALTVPDMPVLSQNTEKSTAAVEKFARHLQDTAYAATAMLSAATKAVLEPGTLTVPSPEKEEEDEVGAVSRRKEQKKAAAAAAGAKNSGEEGGEQDHPGLVKMLRQRWVRSVFRRALLRIRYAKCLGSIADDFVLSAGGHSNTDDERKDNTTTTKTQHKRRPVPPQTTTSTTTPTALKQPASAALFARTAPPPPVPLPGDDEHAPSAAPAARWASSTKPPNKTGSLLNDAKGAAATTTAAIHHALQEESASHKTKISYAAPWTTEDDRRLQLHALRHKQRTKHVLGAAVDAEEIAGALGGPRPQQQQQHAVIFSGKLQLPAQTQSASPAHMKTTVTATRRTAAPGGSSSAFLGRMPPLTGQVEINPHNGGLERAETLLGVVPQTGRRSHGTYASTTTTLFYPTILSARRHGQQHDVVTLLSQQAPPPRNAKFVGPVNDALREFFVLRQDI